MNPPSYISKISTDIDKLEELELKFLLQYDKADEKISKIKNTIAKQRLKFTQLKKQKGTKSQQKQILKKAKLLTEQISELNSTKKSITQKLRTVHRYQQMAEMGFTVNRYERSFDRKSDDNRILEKMQVRNLIRPVTLSSDTRNKIILHAEELQKREFSQIPKSKTPQKRYILGLKVDEDFASPKRDIVEKKINTLRLEWFRKSIDNLMISLKKSKYSSEKSLIRKEIKKLKTQRKKLVTPKDCKKYIKKHYSVIANTNGVTYISTPYRVGFDSDDITTAINELIANYRLKEKNIDVVSIGVIERKIARKQRQKIDYKTAEWEEIEQI